MLIKKLLGASVAINVLTFAAVAQEPEREVEAGAEDSEFVAPTVIVSAQRREQGLAEVPISITVVDGEALERMGISRVEDLYAIAPSLSFSPAQSSSGAGLRIRGVGSAAFGSATEPSVSTIVDGIVTGPGGSALVDFFDLERVEVLRGPQGTLFGKNSSAGAVNIVSRSPTDDLSGFANIRYGDLQEETRVEAAISGPLGNGVRARLSGYMLDQNKGQIWNPVQQKDENKRERFGIRFRGDYETGGSLFDFIVQYEEQDNECCRTAFYGLDPTAYGTLTRLFLLPRQAANNLTPGPDNRMSITDGPLNESTETLQLTGTYRYNFENGLQFKTIVGYRTWSEFDTIDVDGVDINIGNDAEQGRELDLLTVELQLISPDTDRFNWVLGGYFYDQVLETNTITAGGEGTFLGQSSTVGQGETKVQNMAVYADGTYDLNEAWELFGGLRLLYEEIEVDSYRSGNFFAFPPGTFSGFIAADDTNWVGRVGVRYTPVNNQSYYLSLSRGYKGRAIDNNTGNVFFNTPERAVLEPETVVAVELGARTSWFKDRLTLNATLFYSNFSNYQASSFDNVTSSQILRNAGELRSQGLEMDFAVYPWDGAMISGGLAYVDAIYEEYVGAPCTVVQTVQGNCPVGGQDLSGQPLANNPEWQYSIRGQQNFDLTSSIGAYVRAEYNWRDDVVYGGDLNPATTQPAFGVANFRAGLTFEDGKYEIVGFVENAFDESYALRIYDSPAFSGSYSAFFGPLRTVGFELRARF